MHSSRMRTAPRSSHLCGVSGLRCMLGYTPHGFGCGDPPGVGLENPPRPDPSTSPLGVGLETPLARPLKPPQVWAWKPARHAGIPPLPWRPARHAGIPPGRHAGIPPPPVNRITDTCKKHNLAPTSLWVVIKQECIPVGCVLPAHYCMGVLPDGGPQTETLPGQRSPLDRDHRVKYDQLHICILQK